LNDLKPKIYFKVDKTLRTSRSVLNLTPWVKLKINKKDARRKLNVAKKRALTRSSIFGGAKTLQGVVIKRPGRLIKHPKWDTLVEGFRRQLSFLDTNTSLKKILHRLGKIDKNARKLTIKELTMYRLYRKELPSRHNTFEMNRLQSVFHKLDKYRVQKNTTRRLIFFSKYLNTRATSYFKPYLAKILPSLDSFKNRDLLAVDRLTRTALLLQPFCKSGDFKRLLFRVDRCGLRINSTKLVLKLLLNPSLANFIVNKDTLIADDNLIADHFTANLVNQTDVNLYSDAYTKLGHSWNCKSVSYHNTDSTMAYVRTFWDSLNFDWVGHNSTASHTSLKNYSDFMNVLQNTVLVDFIKLNIVKNFSYRSHIFNTLAKSYILSDSLVLPRPTTNCSPVSNNHMLTKSIHYSCFRLARQDIKVLAFCKASNVSAGSLFYKHLSSDVTTVNLSPSTTKALIVTTKVPILYTRTDMGSVDIQLDANQESFRRDGVSRNGEVTSCPTIFTLKLNVSDYLSEQLFITYANSNEGNNFVKYHYSETNEPTINLHTANNFVQSPFLINWNENISENLVYLQPEITGHCLDVDDKLLSLLTSFRGSANSDPLPSSTNSGQPYSTDRIATVPGSNLVLHQSNISTNPNDKLNKKLLRALNTTLKSFINQTGVSKNATRVVELLKYEADLNPDLISVLKMIRRRYKVRSSILKFSPQYASFLIHSFCKSWIAGRISRKIRKLDNIKEKKKYLLFDKKKNRKRNPKFYNKIVKMESAPIIKTLKKRSKTSKKIQYVKKYINYSGLSRWARNIPFYKRHFLVSDKNLKINKLEIFEAESADLISDFDNYVDELQSFSVLPDFSGFNSDSEFASSDYISWLLNHRARNSTTSSLKSKIEQRKSYNIVSVFSENPHHLPSYKPSDLTSYLTSNIFFLNTMLTNQFLLKYLITRSAEYHNYSHFNIGFSFSKPILYVLNSFCFGSRFELLYQSNLFPTESFSYTIQRRLLKCFALRKFISSTGAWYHHMLVRFMSKCTGRKVYLKLNPHVENNLTFEDRAQCVIWENRVLGFQKILGPRIFIEESLRIILIALKYKDPTFLINWMRTMLYRMSFWKYRTLFRYLKFVINDLFAPNFEKFGLRGFKVKLKGKISVAGNARTRTLLMRVGQTSHSKFNNKVAHSFTLVNSFTGVMGFNLWIFF